MSDSSPRDSAPRRHLFVVPYGPLPDLIEWPEDEFEAAALRAEAKRIGNEWRALRRTVRDESRWREATAKLLTAIRYYLETHADAMRDVDGSCVYSDDFRRFVLALVHGPGEGMSPAELAYATNVPQAILEDWLRSQTSL